MNIDIEEELQEAQNMNIDIEEELQEAHNMNIDKGGTSGSTQHEH